MTEDFEKFLEDNSLRVEWQYFEEKEAEMPILFEGGRLAVIKDNDKVMPLKTLGEWAWSEIEPMLLELYLPFFEDYPRSHLKFEGIEEFIADLSKEPLETDRDWFYYCFSVFWRMAISCLGKEEIEKRLKEVGK